jgi:hypothetical protein
LGHVFIWDGEKTNRFSHIFISMHSASPRIVQARAHLAAAVVALAVEVAEVQQEAYR